MIRRALALVLIAATVVAAPSYERQVADFSKPAIVSQWDISLRQGMNGYVLPFDLVNGRSGTTNVPISMTGWTAVLSMRKPTGVEAARLTGTVSGNEAVFSLTGAFLASPVKRWVLTLYMTQGSNVVNQAAGTISIEAAPDVDSGDLVLTRSINIGGYTWVGAFPTSTIPATAISAPIAIHAGIIAGPNTLGHVMIGTGIDITPDGVISASGAAPSWDDVTDKPAEFPPAPHDYSSITNPPWLTDYTETDPLAISNLTEHIEDTDNPHAVTALQVGAVATNDATYMQTVALAASAVATNDARYLASLTNAAAFATAAQGTLADTAWQNPASATNFTWTSDGNAVTITGYSGPDSVVIPDRLDGLPVRSVATSAFRYNTGVTSIIFGANIQTVATDAFSFMTGLSTVQLNAGFSDIPYGMFGRDGSLASIVVPSSVSTVGQYAFFTMAALTNVTFSGNAPAEAGSTVFEDSPNAVIYVSNPTATGWGATWNGCPVVRMGLSADSLTLNGDTITNWPSGGGSSIPPVDPIVHYTDARQDLYAPTQVQVSDGAGGLIYGVRQDYSNITSRLYVDIPQSRHGDVITLLHKGGPETGTNVTFDIRYGIALGQQFSASYPYTNSVSASWNITNYHGNALSTIATNAFAGTNDVRITFTKGVSSIGSGYWYWVKTLPQVTR